MLSYSVTPKYRSPKLDTHQESLWSLPHRAKLGLAPCQAARPRTQVPPETYPEKGGRTFRDDRAHQRLGLSESRRGLMEMATGWTKPRVPEPHEPLARESVYEDLRTEEHRKCF